MTLLPDDERVKFVKMVMSVEHVVSVEHIVFVKHVVSIGDTHAGTVLPIAKSKRTTSPSLICPPRPIRTFPLGSGCRDASANP